MPASSSLLKISARKYDKFNSNLMELVSGEDEVAVRYLEYLKTAEKTQSPIFQNSFLRKNYLISDEIMRIIEHINIYYRQHSKSKIN